MYKVRKKDGSLQDFDRNKIVNSVLNAGGTNEDSQKVASEVEAWLPTVAVEEVVGSQDIRNKVLEVLRMTNPPAASNFESYQKQA